MSSEAIIKSVSRKLKYYIDVKRLEDGFDLSGPDCPKLDHPPLKPRATLAYDGLHDRPLKHYFAPQDIRVALTQFKAPPGKKSRERDVKKKLDRHMLKYNYAPSTLSDSYYTVSKKRGKKLRNELQGFGVPLRKKNMPHHGKGYPVLRMVPPSTIPHAEAKRLVNMATKLLVSTEIVDLGRGGKKRRPHRSRSAGSGAPKPFESSKSLPSLTGSQSDVGSTPRKARSRKVFTTDGSGDEDDSAYQTPSPRGGGGNYVTIDGTDAGDDEVPAWLKQEIKSRERSDSERVDNSEWVRPVSASPALGSSRPDEQTQPHPPHMPRRHRDRPVSAGRRRVKAKDGSSASDDSSNNSSSSAGRGEDLSTQTGGELLKHYNAMDKEIGAGERTRYRVHVHTGDRMGASTKAPIRLVLIGDRGRTKELPLKNSSTHKVKFQRGQEDVFMFEDYHVGPLRRIGIGHDKREFGFGWYLDKVEVKDIDYHKQYVIPAAKWLSANDPDALTFREFEVKSTMHYDEESTSDGESVRDLPKEPISYEQASEPSIRGESDSHSERSMEMNTSVKGSQKSGASSDASDTESEYSESSTTSTHSSVADKSHFIPAEKNDDFFDQKAGGADYTSVIESLSTGTSADNKQDFPPDKDLAQKGPLGRRPTLQPILTDSDEDDNLTIRSETASTVSSHAGTPPPGVRPGRRMSVVLKVPNIDEEITKGPNIHEACKTGDLERVKFLLNSRSNLKDTTNELGWRPLHIAASCGHTAIVNWLMTYGVSLDETTPTGYTAAHLAAQHGHLGVVAVLGAMGANVSKVNVEHQTPLHIAAAAGQFECVKWMVLNDIDPAIPDNLGRQAEDLANENNHTNVYNFLRNYKGAAQTKRNSDDGSDSSGGSSSGDSETDSERDSSDEDDSDDHQHSDETAAADNGGLVMTAAGATDGDTENVTVDSSEDSDSDDSTKQSSRSGSSSGSGGSATTSGSTRSSSHSGTHRRSTSRASTPDTPQPPDPHLMEKRKLYEEQQAKMKQNNQTFMDSLREDLEQ